MLDIGQLIPVDTAGIINITGGVRQGNDFCAHFQQLFSGVLGHVAGTGYQTGLPFQTDVAGRQHFSSKINTAITGGLGPNKAAPPVDALAGQGTAKFIVEPFKHSKEITDFSGTDTDVGCRNIRIGPYVMEQLAHKALAKAHDFIIRFAFGVKIRTAGTTA